VDCYEDWIAVYGYQHRGSVLAFIEAALLTDIDAVDPSCSRIEFGELLRKLGELKRLRSADAAFIQRLLNDELIRRHNASEPDWLVFLLGLLKYPDELDQLLSGVFGESLLLTMHRERSALLQVVRLVALSLPVELLPDDEALLRVAERFTRLADIAFVHETIERRTVVHSAGTP
jgi:type III secretion protein W